MRKGEVKGGGAYTQVRDSATFVDLKREANQVQVTKKTTPNWCLRRIANCWCLAMETMRVCCQLVFGYEDSNIA